MSIIPSKLDVLVWVSRIGLTHVGLRLVYSLKCLTSPLRFGDHHIGLSLLRSPVPDHVVHFVSDQLELALV